MGTKRTAGREQTAAGRRASVAEREKAQEKLREELGPLSFSRSAFEHCRFVGAMTGFKQGAKGDIILEISVAFEHRDLVSEMLHASALPLDIDVVPWRRGSFHADRETNGE